MICESNKYQELQLRVTKALNISRRIKLNTLRNVHPNAGNAPQAGRELMTLPSSALVLDVSE